MKSKRKTTRNKNSTCNTKSELQVGQTQDSSFSDCTLVLVIFSVRGHKYLKPVLPFCQHCKCIFIIFVNNDKNVLQIVESTFKEE